VRISRSLAAWLAGVALLCATLASAASAAGDTLHIGSKRFTESYILGEVLAQTAAPHAKVEHLQGLGNTAIVLAALQAGRIDVYPEYLGTIDLEILKHAQAAPLEQIRRELAPMGWAWRCRWASTIPMRWRCAAARLASKS
jgi:osmoprotectant transport system permease protein